MSTFTNKIDEANCFKTNQALSIAKSSEALRLFSSSIEQANLLDNEFQCIFLDTNIMLDYYGMSKSEKTKLIEFLKHNSSRLFITHQVQKEFLRNRLGAINKDLFTPLNSLYTNYKSTCDDIKNKFKNYTEQKKKILSSDYAPIWEYLMEVNNKLIDLVNDSTLNELINKAVEETTTAHKNITIDDEMLQVCATFTLVEPLDEQELKLVETHYDELAVILEEAKQNEKWKHFFPGSGDKGKDYPYGDFIIYHEMLKHMKGHSTDAIFLTNEKSKYDWMTIDKNPNIHYIEKAYLTTGKIMFILHAEKPLNISFENIHKEKLMIPATNDSSVSCESTVVTINKDAGYGFIYGREGNIYFTKHSLLEPSDFYDLNPNDCISYELVKNEEGNKAISQAKKVVYSFSNTDFPVEEGVVDFIAENKHWGFIQTEKEPRLYFHITSVVDKEHIEMLKDGLLVEFLRGKNQDNGDTVRLMRPVFTKPAFSGN